MSRIERHEDLAAWQAALRLTRAVCALTARAPSSAASVEQQQLRRAAIVVLVYIRRALQCGSLGEFSNALGDAEPACADLQARLLAAADSGVLDPRRGGELTLQIEELKREIAALRLPAVSSPAVRYGDDAAPF